MIANMIDLTARQVQILRAVIEEFIELAEPVGSDTIDKKYSIGVSPATTGTRRSVSDRGPITQALRPGTTL